MLSPIFGDKLYLNLVYLTPSSYLFIGDLPSIIPYYSPFELNLMFCTQSRFTYYFVSRCALEY